MKFPPCFGRFKTTTYWFVSFLWASVIFYAVLYIFIWDDRTSSKQYSDLGTQNDEFAILYRQLGFIEHPKLYPQAYQHLDAKEWPVFALPLLSKDVEGELLDFLVSFRAFFLDHRLVIYDLDLQEKQKSFVQERCFCQIRSVQWHMYPVHVANLKLQAYLPLLIQETLIEFGSVFWCDVRMRFRDGVIKPDISTQALMFGVSAWTRNDTPPSTCYHENTCRYFNLSSQELRYQNLVNPIPALYVNTKKLHEGVMLLWIRCVLDMHCFIREGALADGCDLDVTRSKYQYFSCYPHSMVLFNVALWHAYGSDAPYRSRKNLFKLTVGDTPNSIFTRLKNRLFQYVKG